MSNMLSGTTPNKLGNGSCIIIDSGSDAESRVPDGEDSCGSKRKRSAGDQADEGSTVTDEGMRFMLQWLDDALASKKKSIESSTSTSSDLAACPKVCYVTGRNPPAWMMCDDHRGAESVNEEPPQPLTDSQLIAMLDDDTAPANALQNTRKGEASAIGTTKGVNCAHIYKGHWMREHSHEELTDILHEKIVRCRAQLILVLCKCNGFSMEYVSNI